MAPLHNVFILDAKSFTRSFNLFDDYDAVDCKLMYRLVNYWLRETDRRHETRKRLKHMLQQTSALPVRIELQTQSK